MFNLPIFNKLQNSQRVLIAGAGGGFDVFAGLPLYFALKRKGMTVYLANWTFSDMAADTRGPRQLAEHLFVVTADSTGAYYFPEKYLCQWFHTKKEHVQLYCFTRCGTKPLTDCYQVLVETLKLDTIILVDGGTDSLLRGDEDDLGTPEEDMTSIAAVDQLSVPTKILANLGFGIDSYHGVCHAHVLSMIAEQTRKGGFLGAFSLIASMEEAVLLKSAARFVFNRMPEGTSIVVSSILSAIDGEFGDYHFTERTEGTELFINPLMSIYWFFDLHSLAESIIYMNDLRGAKDMWEVKSAIAGNRPRKENIRPWTPLPL